MAWEHVHCGSVVNGSRGNPPVDCDFCVTLLIAPPEDKGWRKVPGDAPRSKAEKKAAKKAKRKGRNRKRIGKNQRTRIYKRDGYKCVVCGEDDRELLTLDHIVPLSRGGSDKDDNLQTMCRWCNVKKGSKTGSNGMRWPSQREMRRAGWIR